MKKNYSITIIGAGAMGSAIARAVAHGAKDWELTVVDPDKSKLASLTKDYRTISVSTGYESIEASDVVVLAVKPQSFAELADSIAPMLAKNALVVSIMAGRSIQSIQKQLGSTRVVRSMPNLGAQFAESMTVWTGDKLLAKDVAFARAFFAFLGEQIRVDSEDLVDKTTAVSGSGVGFLAYIIEAYVVETEKLGFSSKEATQIVLQTLKATNTLLQKKDRSVAELRKAVTSKAGTTEAGLAVLMGKQFSTILGNTLKKAYKRAKELSE